MRQAKLWGFFQTPLSLPIIWPLFFQLSCYEVFLDRKLERILSILLILQALRRAQELAIE
jgi:hypothetical protein